MIRVSDIAGHLGVNPDYLSHLFHREEKITIKRYILEEKIHRGKNLLRFSDYSIHEIGFYLGFSSQSHFSKIFREVTGVSPGRYRSRFQQKQQKNKN